MPLSEEEQRILHEMERKLYEHDRAFANRVSHGSGRLEAVRATRWWVVLFVAGFALLIATFRFSLALGAIGFLVMLAASLVLAQQIREGSSSKSLKRRSSRTGGIAGELSEMRRRIRSRFGHRS